MTPMLSVLVVAAGLVVLPVPAFAQTPAVTPGDGPQTATAQVKNGSGVDVGQVEFRRTPNGLLLKVELHNLPPGVHGMHIHETGRCEAPDFKSAGGHFSPDGREHGIFNVRGPHAGDLPNVHVAKTGDLTLELFIPTLRLAAGPSSLLDQDGSAFVIHASADDYSTDPAGNAADRIACGVIAEKR